MQLARRVRFARLCSLSSHNARDVKAIPPAINEKWFMTHILPNAWIGHALCSDPIYQQSTAEIEALRASRNSLSSLL
jgi:hypothetical protein